MKKPILNIYTLEPSLAISDDESARVIGRIKAAFKHGESLVKISADNGVSQSTIKNMLARDGTSIKELRASTPLMDVNRALKDINQKEKPSY